MSSRYSKPCNLIQSFIYQHCGPHLSQLCVRMCGGRLLSWYEVAGRGWSLRGPQRASWKGGSGFSGEGVIEPFSHRWEMPLGEGWALPGWALPGVHFSIYLPLSLSATLLPRWQIMLEAEWWGSSWRSCLYHLQKGENLRSAGGFWGG